MDSSAGGGGGGRGEPARWLEIAGKLLAARDLVGCKRLAERAVEADTNLPGADELLASQRQLPSGRPDPVALLQLQPGPDPAAAARPQGRAAQGALLLLLLCLAIFGRGQGRPAVGHGGAVVLPARAAARQDARRGGLPASARGEASASASVPGQRLVEHFLVQEQTDCFCCCCRLLPQRNQSITLAAAAADCFFILAIYGAMEMVTR